MILASVCSATVDFLRHTGADLAHRRTGLGKLRTDFLWGLARQLLRDTVNGEVLHIHPELAAEHIANAYGREAHIPAAVCFAVHCKLSVTQLLCHALAERNAVPNVPLDIKGLILVLIERPHIGRRQLLHRALAAE